MREGGELVETDRDTAMSRVVARSEELLAEQGTSAPGLCTTVHLAPWPDTNVALLNGLLRETTGNDWVDHEQVVGFEQFTERVEEHPPEGVATTCDVPVERIREAARVLGTAGRILSTAAAVQVDNTGIVRGVLGEPGCGLLQVSGRPTAQNTREFRADGDLPPFRNWTDDAQVAEVVLLAATWGHLHRRRAHRAPLRQGGRPYDDPVAPRRGEPRRQRARPRRRGVQGGS